MTQHAVSGNVLPMTVSANQAEPYRAAIERLKKQKIPVTVRAVREEAGGGSFRVVAPVVRAWKRKRHKTAQDAAVKRKLGVAVDEVMEHHRRFEERMQDKERAEISLDDVLRDFGSDVSRLLAALREIPAVELRRMRTWVPPDKEDDSKEDDSDLQAPSRPVGYRGLIDFCYAIDSLVQFRKTLPECIGPPPRVRRKVSNKPRPQLGTGGR